MRLLHGGPVGHKILPPLNFLFNHCWQISLDDYFELLLDILTLFFIVNVSILYGRLLFVFVSSITFQNTTLPIISLTSIIEIKLCFLFRSKHLNSNSGL